MGNFRIYWPCFYFLKLTHRFGRGSSVKKMWIFLCLISLFLLFLKVGYLDQPNRRRSKEEEKLQTRGEHHSYSLDLRISASLGVPTRYNVVYITLNSKRLKPTHIGGAVKSKLRTKMRRKAIYASITQRKRPGLEPNAGQINGGAALQTFWKEGFSAKSSNDGTASRPDSNIRIYSQKAPPWFSAEDIESMRFLADAKVLQMKELDRTDAKPLLMFESARRGTLLSPKQLKRTNACRGQCGIIHSSVDNTEVFAFHLDRVLGLNRTLPAVSRKFGSLHDSQVYQVVLWDASLYPKDPASVRITWREYQNFLTQRCWHRNGIPKSDSGCSSIHYSEWSKLALFDFLLQIHNRLDPSCCGFRPRQEDACVGHPAACKNQENLQLTNIFHREHDLRHLVFMDNKGYFDRNEDNLDFRLLEGIKELPEQAVSVVRMRKLRERLLQSLFLDKVYWESQGGREGIDKLIDVIEKRAKVLLAYINAHGIKVISMND
uniref:Golgi associated kinase 1B n=2 Tax=Cyprinodon variegatus TaxID=28743 RepID=A0A3Q2GBH1_CYPVA